MQMSQTAHPHGEQMEHTSATRRAWITHYQKSGNISATCREFGITRATFYKWLKRYDPARPSRPLRSQSRKNITKRAPRWSPFDLGLLSDISRENPTWGAGKLSQLMQSYEIPLSRATVGRMLSRITKRCPVCKATGGHHSALLHILNRDILAWQDRINRQRAAAGKPELDLSTGYGLHHPSHRR